MTCKRVLSNLTSYIDRELDALEFAAVEEHLEACPKCRDEEREMRWLKRLLANGAECPIDSALEARLREWFAEPRPSGRDALDRPRRSSMWQLAPAGLLALWLLSQSISTSGGPNEAYAGGVTPLQMDRTLTAGDPSVLEASAPATADKVADAQDEELALTPAGYEKPRFNPVTASTR